MAKYSTTPGQQIITVAAKHLRKTQIKINHLRWQPEEKVENIAYR